MKKGKMIVSALALVVAINSAFAFKAKTGPGNLWYYNSDFSCVQAPCATWDQGPGNPCAVGQLYTAEGCGEAYNGEAWVTDCGIK
jgi:hypothetical protein